MPKTPDGVTLWSVGLPIEIEAMVFGDHSFSHHKLNLSRFGRGVPVHFQRCHHRLPPHDSVQSARTSCTARPGLGRTAAADWFGRAATSAAWRTATSSEQSRLAWTTTTRSELTLTMRSVVLPGGRRATSRASTSRRRAGQPPTARSHAAIACTPVLDPAQPRDPTLTRRSIAFPCTTHFRDLKFRNKNRKAKNHKSDSADFRLAFAF